MTKEQKLINEFLLLEAMAEQMREKSYRARVDLERINAPAPSGGSKKKALNEVQTAKLLSDFRKSTIRKAEHAKK